MSWRLLNHECKCSKANTRLSEEKRLLRMLLDDCIIFELTAEIRKLAIEIKQQIKIKTPDAIIAATSRHLQMPLITSDKDFKAIPGIELILI